MTFEGEDIHTAYISGACTHPDYRNQGVMHELLSQAFARMLHNNVALSTLIPAEPWLFDYYGRSGYAPYSAMPKRPLSLPVHRQPIRALLWKCLPNILKKDMNISTGNCGTPLLHPAYGRGFPGYHCRFTTGTGLRLHIEQWGGNHGFGHYLSDRESQLAHWRNRVGYSRNKNFTASTYLPKPESPVHPGSHSSRYR